MGSKSFLRIFDANIVNKLSSQTRVNSLRVSNCKIMNMYMTFISMNASAFEIVAKLNFKPFQCFIFPFQKFFTILTSISLVREGRQGFM